MDVHAHLTSVRNRLPSAIRHRFAIDTRSLAAFRIALGVLVFVDLVRRSRDLTAFYTDFGVLPRTALLTNAHPFRLSFHTLSGEVWFQVVLFLLAGACAVALAIGYRTSFATAVSWVLLVSLHNRNPFVLNGGDVLLRLLLFWAMFLPLGERWSVDSQRRPGGRTPVASVATAALLLQVVMVYTTNAVFKLKGDRWLRGEAIEYVFSLGQFTVLLGDVFPTSPILLQGLNYLWLGAVVLSPLLIVLTGVWRLGFVLLFVLMHLGMLLTLRLDLFPLISIASLLPFLPGSFWAVVVPRLARHRPVAAIGQWLRKLDSVLPDVTITGTPSALIRVKRRTMTAVPAIFLVLVVLWNVQVLGYTQVAGYDVIPKEADPAIELTRTDQYWNMFAPNPLSTDGWVVAPGTLENGSRIDAYAGGPVRWDRPPDISATYPTARWRKYLVGLWRYDTVNRHHFGDYLCRRWNSRHEPTLVNVSVYFMEQPTRIHNDSEPVNKVSLTEHTC